MSLEGFKVHNFLCALTHKPGAISLTSVCREKKFSFIIMPVGLILMGGRCFPHTNMLCVEPPSNGHIGTRHFVLYREVVLRSDVNNVIGNCE